MTIVPSHNGPEMGPACGQSSRDMVAAAQYPAIDLARPPESQPLDNLSQTGGSYRWTTKRAKRVTLTIKPRLKRATSLPAETVTDTTPPPPSLPRSVSFNETVRYLVIERLPEWAPIGEDREYEGDQGTRDLRPVDHAGRYPSHIDVARLPEFAERRQGASERRANIRRLQFLQERKKLPDGDYQGCREARRNRSENKWSTSLIGNEMRHLLRASGSYTSDFQPIPFQEPEEDSEWVASSEGPGGTAPTRSPAEYASWVGYVPNNALDDSDSSDDEDPMEALAMFTSRDEIYMPVHPGLRVSAVPFSTFPLPAVNEASASSGSHHSFGSRAAETGYLSDASSSNENDNCQWGDGEAFFRLDNVAVDDGWVADDPIEDVFNDPLEIVFSNSASDRCSTSSGPSNTTAGNAAVGHGSNDSCAARTCTSCLKAQAAIWLASFKPEAPYSVGDDEQQLAAYTTQQEVDTTEAPTGGHAMTQIASVPSTPPPCPLWPSAAGPSSLLGAVAVATFTLASPVSSVSPAMSVGTTVSVSPATSVSRVSPPSSYPPTSSPVSATASGCPSPLPPPSRGLPAPPPSSSDVTESLLRTPHCPVQ
ncbi:hypothetical protein CspeluHIS016_0209700 [Cutaneotrichosporon spelunceum]|uniref:Uncharacterized protein n=1 Tax=Cutaneotrichosporon spelunceum TaxID=1672016 RepID=A0AAD3YBL6_9TREE|nr:hypothetical protein CspeluHIS016_0209700 [Cutaneotrichosporon spelunceum]